MFLLKQQRKNGSESIGFVPVLLAYSACTLHLFGGVSHTEGSGLTQTEGAGVTHTVLEAVSLSFLYCPRWESTSSVVRAP